MDQERVGIFISEERKKKNLTQQELADLLGVSEKTIGNWEHARCMPDHSMFKLICEEFDISLDELFNGKRQDNKYYINEKNNKLRREPISIGERIRDRRIELGMSQYELSEKICSTKHYVYKIERGLIIPNINTLSLISSVLDISIDDLIYFKK